MSLMWQPCLLTLRYGQSGWCLLAEYDGYHASGMLSDICFIAQSVDSVNKPEQLWADLWIARLVFAYTAAIDVVNSPKAAADTVMDQNSSVKTTARALQE